ncbi:MAG: hypothetical protein Q8Q31_01720 [Nanoarchaeota archaeon]|nr:hypothetical protein [Nanoarchaeota archaeon]
MKTKFPTLALILLVAALIWLFTDLGYLAIDIPWIPIILIIIALGMIINRYSR